MTDDVLARAQQALEGITPAPWTQVGFGNIHAEPVGDHPPVAKTWNRANGDFIAAARTLVPELADALKTARYENLRLRETLRTIEQIARTEALTERARHRTEERRWLDLLAIIERGTPMTDKATHIIADMLAEDSPEGDEGQDARANIAAAGRILDALKTARIELVELPEQEPDSVRVDGPRTVIYEDTVWLTPNQARADAAALLAAAQKAEEYRSGT